MNELAWTPEPPLSKAPPGIAPAGQWPRLSVVTNPSDGELMQRYREGDQQAFAALYERYRGQLFRFIRRQIDAGSAEDLFQEVWTKVIQARERYEPKAQFRTYLYRIAHNTLVDAYRRRGRRPNLVAVEADDVAAPRADQPDERARQAALNQALLAAIRALPDAQRNAFLLREEGGLSLKEIAEVVDVPAETVKSQLRYARDKLRLQLEGERSEKAS